MNTEQTDFFTLLQINDSAFPIGSYTLSWGLETFVQQGEICDSVSAENFLRSDLNSNFLTNELLPVRLAYESTEKGDFGHLLKIDEIYNASKTAKETREGSKKITARFLKTVGVWENLQNAPVIPNSTKYDNKSAWFRNLSHFPVLYGAYCAESGITKNLCLQAFLYSQISARVTTIVKLVPLSQLDGQNMLHRLFAEFPRMLEEAGRLSECDLCRSSPASEIRAMQHEFLYTRLYMS